MSTKNCRPKSIFTALALQVLVLAPNVACARSDADSVTLQYPVLVTTCQVSAGDKYFTNAPILVLAFVVGSNSSYLYERVGGKDKFLAEMHYDEGGLDAQGGVWSSTRAGDVYHYLVSQPLHFVGSKEDYAASDLFVHVVPCAIDYSNLK